MSAEPRRKYARPPITEAVIELQTGASLSDDALQKISRKLKRTYPHAQQRQSLSVKVDGSDGSASVEQQLEGFKLVSEDQTDIVLVKPDGVAALRLAPYCGWESLSDRATDVWNVWRQKNQPSVKRIGIRFINRLDIPSPETQETSLAAYLNVFPVIPPIVAGPMQTYFLRVTFPTTMQYWSATINSTFIAPSPLLGHVSLLLDIDVFRTESIPIKNEDLWGLIGEGHDLKNSIFEQCITEKARELFNAE